jgi:hypothetical protein
VPKRRRQGARQTDTSPRRAARSFYPLRPLGALSPQPAVARSMVCTVPPVQRRAEANKPLSLPTNKTTTKHDDFAQAQDHW